MFQTHADTGPLSRKVQLERGQLANALAEGAAAAAAAQGGLGGRPTWYSMPGMCGAVLVLDLRTWRPRDAHRHEPLRSCAANAERRNHARTMHTMMS